MPGPGPVKVTKLDGSVEIMPAYSPEEAQAIINDGYWWGKRANRKRTKSGGTPPER